MLDKEDGKKRNATLLLEKFELYCYQFQIRETDMIRKTKIIHHLDKMIQAIDQEFNKASPHVISNALDRIIRTEGEQGIFSYLAALKMEELSTDLILLLDALRSALKFSNITEDPALLGFINNCRENEYAE